MKRIITCLVILIILSLGIFAAGPGGSTITRTVTPSFGPSGQIFTVRITATKGTEEMAGIINEIKPSSFAFYDADNWASTFDLKASSIDGDSLDIAFTENGASGYFEYKLEAGSSSGTLSGNAEWAGGAVEDLGEATLTICIDNDGDGYNVNGGVCGPTDCDDNNMNIHPNAEEIPDNEIDDDCDGIIDASFILINSPKAGDYNDKKVIFNISLFEESEYLKYTDLNENRPRNRTLCRDCNEYGLNKKKTKNLVDGEHSLIFYAIKDDKVYEEEVNLFIDSKEPKILKTEPKRNSVINGSEFYIKYNEDNLQNITLFYGYGTEKITKYNCEAGKNKECRFQNVNLVAYNGTWIEYWFEVSDKVNKVESKKTRVFADTDSPVLTVYHPRDEQSYGRNVPFNITVSEDVLLEYRNNSDSTRWVRLCPNCDEYGDSRKRTQSFRKGSYTLQIRATDKAGQVDIEERSFDVDY